MTVADLDLTDLTPWRKPVAISEGPAEYHLALAARIASRFAVPPPVEVYDFADKGNINQHTFLVRDGRGEEYLLQRINQHVFVNPHNTMAGMLASLAAQRDGVARGLVPPGRAWEVITLVPTRDGAEYVAHKDRRETTWWRLMRKIEDCTTYKSLSAIGDPTERLRVAEEAGIGLALYGDLTASMQAECLASPLPGYRDTRVYYNQLLSVLEGNREPSQAERWLPEDPEVRESVERHFLLHVRPAEFERRMNDPEVAPFIQFARDQRAFGLTLLDAMDSGRIRRVGIHGDTKLDNFLFCTRTGQAKALVDLDTIMAHTWLADWGDMVRSLCNVAGEKEPDIARIDVDLPIYRALAKGFLATARAVTPAEVALMADAVEIIALELGIRFLSDFLRGDSYFQVGAADPPDLNKTRAMVQLRLCQRLRELRPEIERCLAEQKGGAACAS